MPLYKECQCLPDELHKKLAEAIECLKTSRLGDTSRLEEERREKLREPLEALAKLSELASPEQVKAIKDSIERSIPLSEDERIFNDLEKFISACRCPDDIHIDWRKFPYGEAVHKVREGKAFVKKIPKLPAEEMESINREIKAFGSKIKNALDDPLVFTNILNDPIIGGDHTKVTWARTRDALERMGELTHDEINRASELNKKYIDSGGSDLIFGQENDFLRIRQSKMFPTKKIEHFRKK